MIEIKIVFRYTISEMVYPPIEEILRSENTLNIISSDRIKNDFLKRKNALSNKINNYINNGELIPTDLWHSFLISMISETQTNIFASGIGNIEQFKEFEKRIETNGFKLSEIIYLKLNDISKLTKMAKEKYSKIYDDEETLRNHIESYNIMREEVIDYALPKYKVFIDDFFSEKVRI